MSATTKNCPPNPAPSWEDIKKNDTIIYIIHGMGQRQHKYFTNIGILKSNANEILTAINYEHKLDNACQDLLIDNKIHFVPIEWHQKMHDLDTVDKRMRLITLPTVPLMRIINNDYLGDIVYFTTKTHGKAIYEFCVEQINQHYQTLLQKIPDFSGKIILLGHSLGGIIGYDILCRQYQFFDQDNEDIDSCANKEGLESMYNPQLDQQLCVKPSAFVTLGCPLAAMLVMRTQYPSTYGLPDGIVYNNIFHPYDPLAYRFEPLVDSRFADIEPVLVDHFNSRKFQLYLKGQYNDLVVPLLPDFSQVRLPVLSIPRLGEIIANSALRSTMNGDVFNSAKELIYTMFGYMHWLGGLSISDTFQTPNTELNLADALMTRESSSVQTDRTKRVRIAHVDQSNDHRRRHQYSTRSSKRLRRSSSSVELEQQHNSNQNRLRGDSITEVQPSAKPSASHPLTEGEVLAEEEKWESELESEYENNMHRGRGQQLLDTTTNVAQQFAQSIFSVMRQSARDNVEIEDSTVASLHAEDLKNETESEEPAYTDQEDSGQKQPEVPDIKRTDYVLRINLLENVSHEYIAGLPAHFSYWSNKDVAFHIINRFHRNQ
ncbi:hypothetical protein MP228_007074 [Amoeboaphelidium protococcarum]|nr:hypothetical protein MP228_007074 [Amoeboaphelidium protococcarum]